MDRKDHLTSSVFDKDTGINHSIVTLNPESELICPNCFERYRIQHDGYIEAKLQSVSGETGDLAFKPDVEYSCTCGKCGEFVKLIKVDSDMADAISMLNKYNFRTVDHCQGHTYDIKKMYVRFAPDIVLPNIPVGWAYFLEENYIETAYKTDEGFRNALSELYEWVNEICKDSTISPAE